MKAKLEFNLPEDQEEFKHACNGFMYKETIDEIWNKCFRKNNKNGYGNKLLDSEQAYDIIDEIAKIYLEIIEEKEISIL